jgi:hypothetical protein
MVDIFRRLRQEHARQRDLANRIMETDAGGERRQLLYRRLKAELEAHAHAEIRVLYAAALRLPDCEFAARRGLFAHRVMARELATLEGLDSSSAKWLRGFRRLREDMEHHTCEEEEFLFPSAAECLHPATASLMTHDYDAHKADRARSRVRAASLLVDGSPAGVSEAAH